MCRLRKLTTTICLWSKRTARLLRGTLIFKHRGLGRECAGRFASRLFGTFQPRSKCRRLCPTVLTGRCYKPTQLWPPSVWSISAGFGHYLGLDVQCLPDAAETSGNRPSMAFSRQASRGRTPAITCNHQQGTLVPVTSCLKQNAETCARARGCSGSTSKSRGMCLRLTIQTPPDVRARVSAFRLKRMIKGTSVPS